MSRLPFALSVGLTVNLFYDDVSLVVAVTPLGHRKKHRLINTLSNKCTKTMLLDIAHELWKMMINILLGSIPVVALNRCPVNLVFMLECINTCVLYTSPSPRDQRGSRMPSSA